MRNWGMKGRLLPLAACGWLALTNPGAAQAPAPEAPAPEAPAPEAPAPEATTPEEAPAPEAPADPARASGKAQKPKVPLAITISGGVSLGAYEGGFLYYLTEVIKRNRAQLD